MTSTRGSLTAELARNADHFAWTHALYVADLVHEAERRDGRRQEIARAASEAGLAVATVRDRVRAVSYLREHDLFVIAEERSIPIGTASAIVKRARVPDEVKIALLREFHGARATPSRDEVLSRLVAPDAVDTAAWLRHGDVWRFPRHDPRFGAPGRRDRLPGQAVQNLLHRYLPQGGRMVSAMCGSGTALDVAAITPDVEAIGFDLRRHPRVEEHHRERFRVFDATTPDWSPVVAEEWADLVLVTPPYHSFVSDPETSGPTDLGAIYDIEEYAAALEPVVLGAARSLAVGGVLVVAMRQESAFDNGTPVPNLVHVVTTYAEEVGFFLSQPVVFTSRRAGGHDAEWLRPEAVHLVTYRRT